MKPRLIRRARNNLVRAVHGRKQLVNDQMARKVCGKKKIPRNAVLKELKRQGTLPEQARYRKPKASNEKDKRFKVANEILGELRRNSKSANPSISMDEIRKKTRKRGVGAEDIASLLNLWDVYVRF